MNENEIKDVVEVSEDVAEVIKKGIDMHSFGMGLAVGSIVPIGGGLLYFGIRAVAKHIKNNKVVGETEDTETIVDRDGNIDVKEKKK